MSHSANIEKSFLRRGYPTWQESRKWYTWVPVCSTSAGATCCLNLSLTIWAGLLLWTQGWFCYYQKREMQRIQKLGLVDSSSNKCSYSILLGGSNYPMQCHSAKKSNKGNQKRVTFDIGIPSVKNLMRLSRRESIFWGFLAASSVPLHLVYNSAIFFSISSHSYSLLVVTPDFLSGASLRNTTQRALG